MATVKQRIINDIINMVVERTPYTRDSQMVLNFKNELPRLSITGLTSVQFALKFCIQDIKKLKKQLKK